MSLPELRYKPKAATARIGNLVDTLLREFIKPAQTRLDPLEEAWAEIVPPGLAAHCRVRGLVNGQLRIGVDSPVYMYELQLCSQELLETLQQRCPRSGLRRLKLTLG